MVVPSRFFLAPDVSRAVAAASAWVEEVYGELPVVHPSPATVASLDALALTLSVSRVPHVVIVDGASPEARGRTVRLCKDAKVVGVGTYVPATLTGVHVVSLGLLSNDAVFTACVEGGMRSSEAVVAAHYGRGSVGRASTVFEALSSRTRVLRLVEAVRNRSWSDVMEQAGQFTGADIDLLREALREIELGEYVLWSARDVEVIAKHREYVAGVLGEYFVAHPQMTAMAIGAGLYFAEAGTVQ